MLGPVAAAGRALGALKKACDKIGAFTSVGKYGFSIGPDLGKVGDAVDKVCDKWIHANICANQTMLVDA